MDLDELMNNLEQNEQHNNKRNKNPPNQGIPHDYSMNNDMNDAMFKDYTESNLEGHVEPELNFNSLNNNINNMFSAERNTVTNATNNNDILRLETLDKELEDKR